MRRDESHQLEAAGQDSFLDVTTNIVGILIVLVIVVAMRVKSSPANAQEQAEAKAKVESLEKQSAAVEYDVRRLQQQLDNLEAETARQSSEREVLATVMVAAEKDLTDRRAKLEAAAQEEFDLKRQLDEAQRSIDRGKKEFADLDAEKPPTQKINHYPTPLSRTVLGDEIHFRLMDGRLAYVPIEEFGDDVRANLKNAITPGGGLPDKVSVVGPRNGFEFRYTVAMSVDSSRGMVSVRTQEWRIVPVGIQQGENVDQALAPRSEFRATLARHNPRDTTVTLWTYPSSFGDYRRVKEELYQLGYATAGRPLPDGVLIGGSVHGTKSSAQ